MAYLDGQQVPTIAEALASRGERIIAIGLNRDVTNLIGSKTRSSILKASSLCRALSTHTLIFIESRLSSAVGRSAVTRRPLKSLLDESASMRQSCPRAGGLPAVIGITSGGLTLRYQRKS